MLETAQELLQIAVPMFAVLLIAFLLKLAWAWTNLIDDQRMRATVQMLVQAAEQEYGPMQGNPCLLYTSPSPRDGLLSRMPSSA